MTRLSVLIQNTEKNIFSINEFFNHARALAFEKYECPLCKEMFLSRVECTEHMELSHPAHLDQHPLFCDVNFYRFISNTFNFRYV
jgi:hypothetical protein